MPDLGIDSIEVKVDTGAKASSLHALDVEEFEKDGEMYVRYKTHPVRRHKKPEVVCESKVLEKRYVKSSTGKRQRRFVITTTVCMGPYKWLIDITLAERTTMEYRMLFGRTALGKNILVSPAKKHLHGMPEPDHAIFLRTKRYDGKEGDV